ncbi:MAG: glucosamine-6-phosphate deaminase [Ruminococcaceae bacterium]|nr:glucosamine-6-phosphate deaminase [Oscillospiraceae bacterium]
MLLQFTKDKLAVQVYATRAEMGVAAADDIAACMQALLAEKETINMVFAAAPSQNDVLASLLSRDLGWERVNAFHMDEYVGLKKEDPQSFGNYLNEHVFSKANFKNVYYVADYGLAYEELLAENHIDIVCLGIGENGHIAFNDPGVADFNDPLRIKKAELDDVCRMQQVHDGCFPTFDDVPTHAYTLTIPQMVSADHMFCVVPAPTKANAVYNTVNLEITDQCPATILRRHDHAVLYCDADSAAKLLAEKE